MKQGGIIEETLKKNPFNFTELLILYGLACLEFKLSSRSARMVSWAKLAIAASLNYL